MVTEGGAVSGARPRPLMHALADGGRVLALALHHVHAAIAIEIGEREAERAGCWRAVEDIERGPAGGRCRR